MLIPFFVQFQNYGHFLFFSPPPETDQLLVPGQISWTVVWGVWCKENEVIPESVMGMDYQASSDVYMEDPQA